MREKLRRAWSRTGILAREIVAKRVAIAAGAGTIAATLVDLDLLPSGVGETATRWVGKGLVVVGVLAGVLWARQGTTPADPDLAPVSSNGVPLVEADPADVHPPDLGCDRAPAGWYCVRAPGHDGPCGLLPYRPEHAAPEQAARP